MNATRLTVLLAVLWFQVVTPARAADADATGQVTLKEKPLAEGKITFHLANDQFVGSKVKNGKFLVKRLPTGQHRVTIEGKGVPKKYGSEETTPLIVEVKEGGKITLDFIVE
jgi:hypothetical protein